MKILLVRLSSFGDVVFTLDNDVLFTTPDDVTYTDRYFYVVRTIPAIDRVSATLGLLVLQVRYAVFEQMLRDSSGIEGEGAALFDAAGGDNLERSLHFLEQLTEHIAPALTNVFLLRRLRSRAGAVERARRCIPCAARCAGRRGAGGGVADDNLDTGKWKSAHAVSICGLSRRVWYSAPTPGPP